jgi:hypothetical protein
VGIRPWASAVFDGERLSGSWGPWPGTLPGEPEPPAAQPEPGPGQRETVQDERETVQDERETVQGQRKPLAAQPQPGPAPPSAPSGAGAVLGWATDRGPVALPVRWNAERSAAAVDSAAVEILLGARRRSPACVVFDDYGGAGPSPKRGAAVHGAGELIEDDDGVWVHLDPERLTAWAGATTGSRRADRD